LCDCFWAGKRCNGHAFFCSTFILFTACCRKMCWFISKDHSLKAIEEWSIIRASKRL
jgi:hypothetical protein